MNYELTQEYEDMLLGKRRTFSKNIPKPKEADLAELIRYAFGELLGWAPEDVYHRITPEVIQTMHLAGVVRLIQFPPELDKDKDFFYIAKFAWPDKISLPESELVLKVYKKVLDRTLKKFPKEFFFGPGSERRLGICLLYAFDQKFGTMTPEEMYRFFSGTGVVAFMREVRIPPCHGQSGIEYPIDLLHKALPEGIRNETYYRFYRFGIDMQKTLKSLPKKEEVPKT